MAEEKEEKINLEEITSAIKKTDESIKEVRNTVEELKGDLNALKDMKNTLDQILYAMKRFEDRLEEIYNVMRDYFKKIEEKTVVPTPVQEPEPVKPVEKATPEPVPQPEPKKPVEIPIPASVITGIFNEFTFALRPSATPHDVINALNNLREKLLNKIREDHPVFIEIDRWVRRIRAYIAEGRIPQDELADLKARAEDWRKSIH
ncbi:MAG: hypothetical protein J7J30_04585 [Candidatus Odinarchaeota archaeon]|nr:hypothetical protein [Candidatus Odinarchaeota archaeon]